MCSFRNGHDRCEFTPDPKKSLKTMLFEKSFDRYYDALGGFASAAGASPVAIVPYYLYTTVQIFSCR